MAKYTIEDTTLIAIADSIRAKTGNTDAITPENMPTEIESIETGGGTEEFVGIKFSDFAGGYSTPKVADARSIPVSAYAESQGNNKFFAAWFYNINANLNGGYYVNLSEVYLPEGIFAFGNSMFYCCYNLTTLHGDFSKVTTIDGNAFYGCSKLPQMPYCPNLRVIQKNAFNNCTSLTEITLPSTVTSIANNAFNGCVNITDIYVPWAEGAVANAPWGATNATIHYNSEV